jgi:predicted N-acetyltransferase YhbS
MNIEYKLNSPITAKQFIDLLNSCTLGERRPVDDIKCIEGMLAHADLTITAWHDDRLVGIARSMTDFNYACYLSDLAVDESFQHLGIGKKLQQLTQEQLGGRCTIILLAAPQAADYYGHIGFSQHPRCWVLGPDRTIS